jgi:GTPase SAR1 family protein
MDQFTTANAYAGLENIFALRGLAEHDMVLYIMLVFMCTLMVILVAMPPLKKGEGILIIGPGDAGKTVLWMRLKEGLAANVGAPSGTIYFQDETFPIQALGREGKLPRQTAIPVIDMPAIDEEMTNRAMSKLSRLAALICVIDMSNMTESANEAAIQLYYLFTAQPMRKLRLPVLLACNKVETDGARGTTHEGLRALLEAEIDRIQKVKTEAATGQLVDGKAIGPEVTMVNNDGEPFTFAKAPCQTLDMVSCSALIAQTEDVVDWLIKHVPALADAPPAVPAKDKAQ